MPYSLIENNSRKEGMQAEEKYPNVFRDRRDGSGKRHRWGELASSS